MGVVLISYPQKLLLKLIGKYLLNPKLEKYIEIHIYKLYHKFNKILYLQKQKTNNNKLYNQKLIIKC